MSSMQSNPRQRWLQMFGASATNAANIAVPFRCPECKSDLPAYRSYELYDPATGNVTGGIYHCQAPGCQHSYGVWYGNGTFKRDPQALPLVPMKSEQTKAVRAPRIEDDEGPQPAYMKGRERPAV